MCLARNGGVMRKDLIDLFFLELSKKTKKPTEVILTGAVAGTLFGHSRPSLDLDFAIRSKGRTNAAYAQYLDELVREISSKLGVDTNYSEDISHWSMIDFLEYRKKAIPYKKIGNLNIKLMAPDYWTIGKMTRFYEIDIQDMIQVIKKRKLEANDLIMLWVRALKASPLSLTKRQFIDHVKTFIKTYGKRAWGKSFRTEHLLQKFGRLLSK